MPWWSNLPSLTPLKGLGKFLYIWTHWEEISADLKKRDDRLQAVEELTEQMVRLKEGAHTEEMRALARTLTEQVDKWRALTDTGLDVAQRAVAQIGEMERAHAELREALGNITQWLAIILVIDSDKEMRDRVLSSLDSRLRELLSRSLGRMEGAKARLQGATVSPPPPLPSQGGMDVR